MGASGKVQDCKVMKVGDTLVNYISEIRAFEKWLETNHLPIQSQLLWYKFMHLFNGSGWAEWITVDNYSMMALMKVKREATFIGWRDELVDVGLIEYKKGRKNKPNRYRMCYLTFKSEVKRVVNSEVQTVVQSVVNTVADTADLNTDEDKTKTNKENIEKKSSMFKPPDVVDVSRYCKERNNNVDPDRFVDFYAAKNWMIGKNKMKDWKAAVRTWERNSKNNSAQSPQYKRSADKFNNFDGRGYSESDFAAMERVMNGL